LKIVVLGIKSKTTWILSNIINKKYNINKIFIINKQSYLQFLKKKILKNNIFSTFGQILFFFYYKILLNLSFKKVSLLLGKLNINHNFPEPETEFFQGTDKQIISKLKLENPDIVIINGTRVLSLEILTSVNAIFINLHCGITPKYKGVHGGYWANKNNDIKNTGVTIHKVTKTLDDGPIFFQKIIKYKKYDNISTFPFKQYIIGAKLLMKVIEDLSNNKKVNYLHNNLKSKIYFHPTIYQYLICLFLYKKK